jgi:SAM-dependent methyltransferase
MIYHMYRDGRHYDHMLPSDGQDIVFWLRQARRYGDPILELGCGTGRVSIPLAQEGFQVTGIDVSDAMLHRAKEKSKNVKPSVNLVKSDIRAFALGEPFSLIIIPNNTLGHLLDLGDLEACLSSVKRHLKPGGKFIIDMFVPKMELLLDKPGERCPFTRYDDPDGRGEIVVTESYVYEADSQIKRITTHHAIPGEVEEKEGRLDIRMYFPQELDALLHYNGFNIDAKFGNYDQAPFSSKAEKQLIICSIR